MTLVDFSPISGVLITNTAGTEFIGIGYNNVTRAITAREPVA